MVSLYVPAEPAVQAYGTYTVSSGAIVNPVVATVNRFVDFETPVMLKVSQPVFQSLSVSLLTAPEYPEILKQEE
jgi:hypothetical protein